MQIPQANGWEGKGEEGDRLVTSEPKELLAGAWVICDCISRQLCLSNRCLAK